MTRFNVFCMSSQTIGQGFSLKNLIISFPSITRFFMVNCHSLSLSFLRLVFNSRTSVISLLFCRGLYCHNLSAIAISNTLLTFSNHASLRNFLSFFSLFSIVAFKISSGL
ncbi:MAG: hypothetical protein WCG25_08360 [bacterium]